ncbi:MAG: methylmalonyl Co-A mutase-associated GTPase MeaB [Chloroflexota bacterium]|nr:methylmalonyl Co-A mutase-associated GTPase MeaB [Chloroflexota bacterium]
MSLTEESVNAGVQEWVRRGLAGERRAMARLITIIENRLPEAAQVMREITPHTGAAHIIGITGAPGSGKSTLTNELIQEFRRRNRKVGVVAIDPTSTLTGGAVLGDRIRMLDNYHDPEVFIRSMATRGQLGGLAAMTNDVVRILDGCGKEVVIVETVGVGQDEVDVARAAHTTILVEVPGMGDDIQAIKAGVLEIADLLVINKADRDGVERLNLYLQAMLNLAPKKEWHVPILKTIAAQRQGIDKVVDQTEQHLAYLKQSGEYEKREHTRLRDELLARVREEVSRRVIRQEYSPDGLQEMLKCLEERTLNLHEAANLLLKQVIV